MMTETVHLEVVKHCFVFQPGCMLDLAEHLVNGAFKGYSIPDVGDGTAGIIPVKSVKKRAATPNDTGEYFGKCMLTRVSNFGKNNIENDKTDLEIIGVVKPEQVRVIHYPDCQQIIFHMPQFAFYAGTFRITDLVTNEVIVETAVRTILSGSTMMQVDSLPLKPGFYSMEANWPNGWTHQIRFIKFIEGFPKVPYENPAPNVKYAIRNEERHLLVSSRDEPKVEVYRHPPGNLSFIQNSKEYRLFDSNGVEMENGLDQQQFKYDLAAKFGPVVEYTQEGRGGLIIYREKEIRITFDWEFAGGNAVVYFSVPEEKYWESHTKTPLARRDDILNFVSRKVIEDKAPGCDFEIYSNSISIVRR